MPEETELEGNLEGQGAAGSPISQTSTNQVQPLSDVAALQKQVEELTKLYKGVQKGNDKVNARMEEKVNNLARILELAKEGKSQGEIEERLILDEIVRERKSSTPVSGTNTERQSGVDVISIAKQLGLDTNDKDISAAVATGDIVNVFKTALSKQSPSPSPSDAPPPGGETPKPADVSAMTSRLAVLQKSPTKHKAEIDKLTKELDAVNWGM